MDSRKATGDSVDADLMRARMIRSVWADLDFLGDLPRLRRNWLQGIVEVSSLAEVQWSAEDALSWIDQYLSKEHLEDVRFFLQALVDYAGSGSAESTLRDPTFQQLCIRAKQLAKQLEHSLSEAVAAVRAKGIAVDDCLK